MIQKPNDSDDTILLAKVSLLMKEKNILEAISLLQVKKKKTRQES